MSTSTHHKKMIMRTTETTRHREPDRLTHHHNHHYYGQGRFGQPPPHQHHHYYHNHHHQHHHQGSGGGVVTQKHQQQRGGGGRTAATRGHIEWNPSPSLQSSSSSSRAPPHPPTVERMRLPKDYQPTSYCVLCGRTKECYNSSGNRHFRYLVNLFLGRYSKASDDKAIKGLIVKDVIATIRNSGGRFVKYEEGSRRGGSGGTSEGYWWEVGDAFAREKVGNYFRDCLFTKYRSSCKAKTAKRRLSRGCGKEGRRQLLSASTSTSTSTSPSPSPSSPSRSASSSPSSQLAINWSSEPKPTTHENQSSWTTKTSPIPWLPPRDIIHNTGSSRLLSAEEIFTDDDEDECSLAADSSVTASPTSACAPPTLTSGTFNIGASFYDVDETPYFEDCFF